MVPLPGPNMDLLSPANPIPIDHLEQGYINKIIAHMQNIKMGSVIMEWMLITAYDTHKKKSYLTVFI